MNPDALFEADPEVVACEFEGAAALLDLRTSLYFSLNPVGAAIWWVLGQQPSSLDAVCRTVSEKFDVTAADCRSDVAVLLDELCRRNLARRVDVG